MSEKRLASQLRKKYQQQPNDDEDPPATTRISKEPTAATARVLKVDREDQVAIELESLKERYARLLMNAESALETANPSPRQLKRFSQLYVSDRVVTTVEELFDCLGEFSFLDYALLERTISMFLKEAQPLVSALSDYIQQLKSFKKSTTMSEFMETIETAQSSITTEEVTGTCTVILRLVGGWLTKTMEDLDKLLKEIFQDKSSILAHLTIVRGSVIVSYLAPQSEANSLLKLAQAKLLFVAQVGVCDLLIGHTAVIKAQNEWTNFSFEFSLIRAVKNNEINLLTFLLNINTSPDTTDTNGWTALMIGSYYDHHRAVSILLQSNANPSLKTDNGVTPLYKAAYKGHSDTVSILLEDNANPNLQTDNGATPLCVAAQNGHTDTVCILLQANANPNLQTDSGVTPLLMAAKNGHSDIVSILLQANANPSLRNSNGVTPLHMAVENGHSDIASILTANSNYLQADDDDDATYLCVQSSQERIF